jgi:hypothetical protein
MLPRLFLLATTSAQSALCNCTVAFRIVLLDLSLLTCSVIPTLCTLINHNSYCPRNIIVIHAYWTRLRIRLDSNNMRKTASALAFRIRIEFASFDLRAHGQRAL